MPDETGLSGGLRGGASEGPPGYEARPGPASVPGSAEFLQRYGEAMMRIGRLEEQVRSLQRRLDGDGGTGSEGGGGSSAGHLSDRTRGATASSAGAPAQATYRPMGDSARGSPQARQEIEHLQLQMVGLAQKLAQTENELHSFKGGRVRRRSSHGHRRRAWWNFWSRRHH